MILTTCAACAKALDHDAPAHCVNCQTKVIVDPEAPARKRARTFPEKPPYYGKNIEGATQKQSGKWKSQMFPGREFDDLDAYRAAKKQRAEQRAAYSDQLNAFGGRRG